MDPISGTKRSFSQREDALPVARKKPLIVSSLTSHTLSSATLAESASSPHIFPPSDIRNYFSSTAKQIDASDSSSKLSSTSATAPAFLQQSAFLGEEDSDTEIAGGSEVYHSGLESDSEDIALIRHHRREEPVSSEASNSPHATANAPFEPPWEVDHEVGSLPTDIKEIPATVPLPAYLEQKQIYRNRLPYAKGACGKVYLTTIEGHVHTDGTSIPYLYKAPTQRLSLDDWGSKPHRYSDLAAARLDDLPHIVKPLFLILGVTTTPEKIVRRFYVPLQKAKEFGSALPPGSRVEILGQVIPKAPGENLQTLMARDKNLFNPSNPHFKAIMVGLSKFLITAYPHNFIHRDLKPDNIIYDPVSQMVTIIDTGLSLRLRRRGKEDEDLKGPSNPTTTKQRVGTPHFRSPFVLRPNGYGSEVDFHGMALVALSLISESDFDFVSSQRIIENRIEGGTFDALFRRVPPTQFLNQYMTRLPRHEAPTTTQTTLEAHPEVKQFIELCFEISAGGTAGAAALEKFKALPYFQKES